MLSQFRTTWGLAAGVLAGLAVLFAVGLALVRPQTHDTRNKYKDLQNDDSLDQARELLSKANNSAACRSALQQLNVRLGHHAEQGPEPLTDEQRQRLRDQLGLGPDELAEVENPSFSLLDAHHVDVCFLLDDVIRALDVRGLSQPEQAAAAFAWVTRQVRPVERDEDLLPADFALHRGWGTARQRALVFVNLLEQLGIPGCVLATDDDKEPLRPWACGALVSQSGGKKEVLLFDTRLGLPLPGPPAPASPEQTAAFRLALPVPGGEDRQPASLAAVRRQFDLLDALKTDDRHAYDITRRQLEESRLYLVGMLSALAPRMRTLQENLPSARADVRVTFDPAAALTEWKAVASALGEPAPEVRFWKEATRSAFTFWPPEEGGSDKAGRLVLRLAELIPRQALPRQVADLEGEPGHRVQMMFNRSFVSYALDPGRPPDLVLRGEFDEAARALVETRDQLREEKARLAAAVGVDQKLQTWVGQLYEAQANLTRAQRGGARDSSGQAAVEEARAQLDRAWKEGGEVVGTLVEGKIAEVQLPDVTYLLALCKQEQAERLERQRHRGGTAADAQAVRDAWADATSWWDQYAADLAATDRAVVQLARRGSPAAARLLDARAHEARGQRDEAARLLQDPSDLTTLEQTARLYLAHQLKKP
jgi:hypothetical protein